MTRASRVFSGLAVAAGLAVALTACTQGTPVRVSGDEPTPTASATAPSVPTAIFTLKPVTPSTATPTATPTATAIPTATASQGSEANEVVRLTNVERGKAGCGALTVDPRLTAAAQGHSADMAANNYFDHNSRNGNAFSTRIQAAGFPLTLVGENIAAGQTTPANVVQAWMNSAGHRANILNCSYNRIGVGYATGGSYHYYWTQDLGRL